MAWRDPRIFVAVVVVTILVLTGPLFGSEVTRSQPTAFGEGTASVAAVDIETAALRITPGRFGTDVEYLRIPDASVTVSSVDGRPRLVYLIEVPALDLSLSAYEVITSPSTYRLDHDDRGLERGSTGSNRYVATLTVRVQSFSGSKTVHRENATVEVML